MENQKVTHFSEWLQREYLNRRVKNQSYSIRSFARYLKLDPSTVSQLLSGKRKPSQKFAKNLFGQLDIAPDDREIIMSSLGMNTNQTDNSYHLIALDSFKLLSDWHHFAILELTSVKDFKYDFVWIANQLNLSVTEVRQAIERLLRLDLLQEKNGRLIKTNSFVTNYDEGSTDSALKTLQRHVLQKALDAIDAIPQNEKDITSMTMAIDESKLPEAKKKIKNFRRLLCKYLEKGNQTRVYNLGIQLYPLSKGTKRKIYEN